MQSLSYRKKTSPFKTAYRNDPNRFFGDGVMFKAKLIGILEVGEARGDKMCQEALQDLKIAIRAAGEHKQRITIHVTIDGLRLRDEKSNDSLYHHPVHKISFIAQDMSDSRAFGYIFGSPDSGHRFFGIKTDKAASLVVLAMRDLFQVVFELKKKEIEHARQQIQSVGAAGGAGTSRGMPVHASELLDGVVGVGSLGVTSSGRHAAMGSLAASAVLEAVTNAANAGATGSSGAYSLLRMAGSSQPSTSKQVGSRGGAAKEMSPESVADLVDLEQELSSLQRGITQMERITPSEPAMKAGASAAASATSFHNSGENDPFGDSFTTAFPTYNLLPPPESARARAKPHQRTQESAETAPAIGMSNTTSQNNSVQMPKSKSPQNLSASTSAGANITGESGPKSWVNVRRLSNSPQSHSQQQSTSQDDQPAKLHSSENIDRPTLSGSSLQQHVDSTTLSNNQQHTNAANNGPSTLAPTGPLSASTNQFRDAFTDLDPLGTGKSKPYIDKKFFFHELKNPPKKVLRDLSEHDSVFSANFASVSVDDGGGVDEETHRHMNNEPSAESHYLTDDDNSNVHQQQQQHSQQQHHHDRGEYGSDVGVVQFPDAADPPLIGNNQALLVSDNDPFSPRMRTRDLFEDDFGGQTDAAFEFGFAGAAGPPSKPSDFSGPLQVSLPPERRPAAATSPGEAARYAIAGRTVSMDTEHGDFRSRPAASSVSATGAVFRQKTVDSVMSSLNGAKKIKPFGSVPRYQRHSGSGSAAGGSESNTINMRRLQESDSLSESESAAAPEPPPRSTEQSSYAGGQQYDGYAQPPPLPPKKQYSSDQSSPPPSQQAPRLGSSSFRYYAQQGGDSVESVESGPALPVPARKVGGSSGPGRYASSGAGPARPAKRGQQQSQQLHQLQHSADDGETVAVGFGDSDAAYMTPISSGDAILLPPPQHRTLPKQRGRRMPEPQEVAAEQVPSANSTAAAAGVQKLLPDITLSELLTLGIDELAHKLSVPADRLSTMNIVELTQYLSEYVQRSMATESTVNAPTPTPHQPGATTTERQTFKERLASGGGGGGDAAPEAAVFKVSFDADNEATFIAKFDDNFGEPDATQTTTAHDTRNQSPAIPNFANFNEAPSATAASTSAVDRYAVFREIIEQEMGDTAQTSCFNNATNNEDDETQNDSSFGSEEQMTNSNEDGAAGQADQQRPQPPVLHRIDTNITQVIAQAKDRYAALRDIIMVEDLFEKPTPLATTSNEPDRFGDSSSATMRTDAARVSPEVTVFISNAPTTNTDGQPPPANVRLSPSLQRSAVGSRDDLEINEYMNRAISQLSLDSRGDKSPSASALLSRSGTGNGMLLNQPASSPSNNPSLLNVDGGGGDEVRRSSLNVLSATGSPHSQQQPRSPVESASLFVSASSIMANNSAAVVPQPRSPMTPKATGIAADMQPQQQVHKQSLNSAGSLSDVVMWASSPDGDKNIDQAATSESWAVFDPVDEPSADHKKTAFDQDRTTDNTVADNRPPVGRQSADSSDDQHPRQQQQQQHPQYRPRPTQHHHQPHQPAVPPQSLSAQRRRRTDDQTRGNNRWPQQQQQRQRANTSSSSRDLSPWDDDSTPTIPPPPPSASVAAADLRRRTGGVPRYESSQIFADRGQPRWHPEDYDDVDDDDDDNYDGNDDDRHHSSRGVEYRDAERGVRGSKAHQSQLTDDDENIVVATAHRRRDNHNDGDSSPSRPSSYRNEKLQRFMLADSQFHGPRAPHRHLDDTVSSPDDDDDDDNNAEYAYDADGQRRRLASNTAGRVRSEFERSAYERSTFGPPYEKRGVAVVDTGEGSSYDQRQRVTFGGPASRHQRQHRQTRSHRDQPGHHRDYATGGGGYRGSSAGAYDTAERGYERRERTATAPGFRAGAAANKQQRAADGRRSFDCESNDSSFDFAGGERAPASQLPPTGMSSSGGGGRRRSHGGSGDIYGGGRDSRESELSSDRRGGDTVGKQPSLPLSSSASAAAASAAAAAGGHRSLRRPPKAERIYQEYLQYSDGEVVLVTTSTKNAPPSQLGGGPPPVRRGEVIGDTRSLQRGGRTRKSSGSSPWDGEELTPTSQTSWKRPGSAAESDRRMADLRGVPQQFVQGSDGEKDRRFRKKLRTRTGKELDSRGNSSSTTASSMRHQAMGQHYRSADFGGFEAAGDYDDDDDDDDNVDKFSYQVGGGGGIGRRQYEAFKSAAARQQMQQQQQQMHSRPPQKPVQPAKPCINDYEPERARNMDSMRDFSRSSRDVYGGGGGGGNSYKDVHPHYAGSKLFDQHYGDEVNSPQQQMQPSSVDRSAGAAIPRSESNKLSGFDDEQGFESDFNSPSNNGRATQPAMPFAGEQPKPPAAVVADSPITPRPQTGGGGRTRQPSASSATSATAVAPAVGVSNMYTPKGGGVSTPSALEPPSPVICQPATEDATAAPMSARRTPTPKLRFDDCVSVAKFDSNAAELFDDDDFSKAEFSFEAEDQWNAQLPPSKRVLKPVGSVQQQQARRQLQQQQDNLRKSESVNIFAKSKDDPFKDDDFFEASSEAANKASTATPDAQLQQQQPFKWENDFAKFDENI